MAVDFLDIAPKEDRKSVVSVKDQSGNDVEVEVFALDASDFAAIARKHPVMRPVFAKGAPEEVVNIALAEAGPAIIAAGLGHLNDERYELAAKRYQASEQKKLVNAIMALSVGEDAVKAEEADGVPLPTAAEIVAEATAGGVETAAAADSQQPSNT